jgi:hypothetical protein
VFQSYAYEYKGYDQATAQYHYKIVIVDPDFGEETITMETKESSVLGLTEGAVLAVIKLYSGKGYSPNQIAKNLWLLFEFNQRRFTWRPTNQQVEWCLEHLPEYQLYHETIQMLMLFS